MYFNFCKVIFRFAVLLSLDLWVLFSGQVAVIKCTHAHWTHGAHYVSIGAGELQNTN